MKWLLLFFAWFLCGTLLSGQTLEKVDSSKQKILEKDYIYEFYIQEKETTGDKKCFNCLRARGQIAAMDADSIHIKLVMLEQLISSDSDNEVFSTRMRFPVDLGIAKSDLYQLRYYKSEKHRKRKKQFRSFSAVAFAFSVVSLTNALILDDKDSKNTLFLVSGISFGSFITLGILGNSKRYQLKGDEPRWKFY